MKVKYWLIFYWYGKSYNWIDLIEYQLFRIPNFQIFVSVLKEKCLVFTYRMYTPWILKRDKHSDVYNNDRYMFIIVIFILMLKFNL